jgi:hypothetical protein
MCYRFFWFVRGLEAWCPVDVLERSNRSDSLMFRCPLIFEQHE